MSLNFFKTTPQKTDATLQFKTVLNDLKEKNDIPALNIDEFILKENIDLGLYQEFYKESKKQDITVPNSITKEDIQQDNTRTLVNTVLELTKDMPEYKVKGLEYHKKVKDAMNENNQTINNIKSIDV